MARVVVLYTRCMGKKVSKLQLWMTRRGVNDAHLEGLVEVSRVQISRIRRLKSGASPRTAKRLQAVTKIAWHHFVQPVPRVAKKGVSR